MMKHNLSVEEGEGNVTSQADDAPGLHYVAGLESIIYIMSAVIIIESVVVQLTIISTKRLWTYHNGLLLSLSFSDLLIGAILLPSEVSYWGSGYIVAIALFSNIGNICAITIERFICIAMALQSRYLIAKYYKKMLVSVWVISLFLTVLPVVWGANHETMVHKVFVVVICIGFFLSPLFFILLAYIIMFYQVRKSRRSCRMSRNGCPDKLTCYKGPEIQVAILSAVIACILSASWVPLMYLNACYVLGREDLATKDVSSISLLTISLSSVACPALFSVFKHDIRNVLMDKLTQAKNCICGGSKSHGVNNNERQRTGAR